MGHLAAALFAGISPEPGDACDDDDDNDTLLDVQEDANGNGLVDPGETDPRNSDTDGDLISDGPTDPDQSTYDPVTNAFFNGPIAVGPDNCPLTPNPLQEDWDGDGIGDACDT